MLKTVSETRGGIMFTSAQRKRRQNMVALVKHFQELETPPPPTQFSTMKGSFCIYIESQRVTNGDPALCN